MTWQVSSQTMMLGCRIASCVSSRISCTSSRANIVMRAQWTLPANQSRNWDSVSRATHPVLHTRDLLGHVVLRDHVQDGLILQEDLKLVPGVVELLQGAIADRLSDIPVHCREFTRAQCCQMRSRCEAYSHSALPKSLCGTMHGITSGKATRRATLLRLGFRLAFENLHNITNRDD